MIDHIVIYGTDNHNGHLYNIEIRLINVIVDEEYKDISRFSELMERVAKKYANDLSMLSRGSIREVKVGHGKVTEVSVNTIPSKWTGRAIKKNVPNARNGRVVKEWESYDISLVGLK